MDPTAIVNLALLALQAILNVINQIKSSGGMTDDQIAAQVQVITQGNDAAYAQIIAALGQPPKGA